VPALRVGAKDGHSQVDLDAELVLDVAVPAGQALAAPPDQAVLRVVRYESPVNAVAETSIVIGCRQALKACATYVSAIQSNESALYQSE
jgi:hypothetical protein